MENVPGPQSKAQQLPTDTTLPNACLPRDWGLGAERRPPQTTLTPYKDRLSSIKQTGLTIQIFPQPLRMVLALGQQTPAEKHEHCPQRAPQTAQGRSQAAKVPPIATYLSQSPGAQLPYDPTEKSQKS